jgi:hypothetical protein
MLSVSGRDASVLASAYQLRRLQVQDDAMSLRLTEPHRFGQG